MMRSLYAGVSGLRNHQLKMDVIGNNIANVNTIGFKKSRVNFQEMFYQTLRGASSPQGSRGGTNPRQIGLGVAIASIDTMHTPGSSMTTGKMSDLMVEGDGFFVMDNNGQNLYTRAGTFDFDRDGNFTNPANGMKVKGWMADPLTRVIDSTKAMDNIVIPQVQLMKPLATKNIVYANNLDAQAAVGTKYPAPPVEVYDSLGNPHQIALNYQKTGVNTWGYTVSLGAEDPLIKDQLPSNYDDLPPAAQQSLLEDAQITAFGGTPGNRATAAGIGSAGLGVKLTAVNQGTGANSFQVQVIDGGVGSNLTTTVAGNVITVSIDAANAAHSLQAVMDSVNNTPQASILVTASLDAGAVGTAQAVVEVLTNLAGGTGSLGAGMKGSVVFDATGTLDKVATSVANAVTQPILTNSFTFNPTGTDPVVITPDITALTQYNSESSVRAQSKDGNSPGSLQTYTIDSTGVISGVYSNGLSLQLAQLALSKFNAPGGLIKMGENLYQESNNSGSALIGAPGSQGIGMVTPGSLEMSNVELAQEFSDMIVTQRGFQANSRIITTSDQMLEELVNLKR